MYLLVFVVFNVVDDLDSNDGIVIFFMMYWCNFDCYLLFGGERCCDDDFFCE